MNQHNVPRNRARGINGYFLGFLAIIGYFLFTEHRAHVVPYLPFLLLLACPLMHFFMHRGHGHGRHGQDEKTEHGSCCGHPPSGAGNDQEPTGLPENNRKYPDRPA
ncbi:DUF2933 domain-containing protein [Pseudomonas sp. SK3(2021)]|uniref:DUF2933 domain-containing protein n=1 Tax=Pseudomonas sp. SK3(2021) TaxID=2841064 RepID=UPI00192BBE63|nr:DUF2933 domain-containing protein [Pseudomonas sp. SK3(2021)]QQZ39453.1 DUF2933 domain-containing protein [Pseudomonas sp. SK3(2021)]